MNNPARPYPEQNSNFGDIYSQQKPNQLSGDIYSQQNPMQPPPDNNNNPNDFNGQ